MKINLQLIQEELGSAFLITGQNILPDHRVDCARSYLSQPALNPNTLYLVPTHQLPQFLALARVTDCSAILFGVPPEQLSEVPRLSYLVISEDTQTQFLSVLSALQDLFERLSTWEGRLLNMRGRGYELKDFLKAGYDMIRNPMILYNGGYLITATTQEFHAPPQDTAWTNLIHAGYWTPDVRSAVRAEGWTGIRNQASIYDGDSFEHKSVLTSFFVHAHFMGTLFIMEYSTPITPGRLQLIQAFADILHDELLENEKGNQDKRDILNTFIQTVLNAAPDSFSPEFVNYHLAQLGWTERSSFYVLVFQDQFRVERGQYMPEHIRRLFPTCYCTEINNQLVAIINADAGEFQDASAKLAGLLRESVMKCGVSTRLPGFLSISYGYQQAQAALGVGEKLDPTFWCYHYGDYALEHIVSFALEGASLETLCHPAILQLEQEDRRNGSSYIATLDAYFAASSNLKKAAEAMHMHRNTLQYRLNRISQLTGVDLGDDSELKKLYISLRILRVHRKTHPEEAAK